jgi:hypothetical protein
MADESPNRTIDKLLKDLMKKAADQPIDVAVKVIAQAISWERVKHKINDDADEFDPDKL